jgi:hypothetical protein
MVGNRDNLAIVRAVIAPLDKSKFSLWSVCCRRPHEIPATDRRFLVDSVGVDPAKAGRTFHNWKAWRRGPTFLSAVCGLAPAPLPDIRLPTRLSPVLSPYDLASAFIAMNSVVSGLLLQ